MVAMLTINKISHVSDLVSYKHFSLSFVEKTEKKIFQTFSGCFFPVEFSCKNMSQVALSIVASTLWHYCNIMNLSKLFKRKDKKLILKTILNKNSIKMLY